MRRLIAAAVTLIVFSVLLDAQSAIVTVDKANLRGRPADDAKVVETLGRNTRVDVVKVEGLWYLVQSADYAGWMFIKDLDVKPSAATTTAKPLIQTTASTAAGPSVNGTTSAPRTTPDAKGRTYVLGPRGGCYYLNPSGSKAYVSHDLCK
ncbi:MAG: SH3 domain-containing protein [Pyrinomonadaceae bacterium]